MSETVVAKFRCESCTETMAYISGVKERVPVYEYSFSAVIGGSPENESFFAWTPSGSIKLGAIKAKLFEIGKEYYIDFNPVLDAPRVTPY